MRNRILLNLKVSKSILKENKVYELKNTFPYNKSTEFGILMPRRCPKFFSLQVDETHLYSGIDGSMMLVAESEIFSNEEYCADFIYFTENGCENTSAIVINSFVCQLRRSVVISDENFLIYPTLLAVSAAFLAFTFTVYICLPELLNLHGKTLICYVSSLFVAFVFLSFIQFSTRKRLVYGNCQLFGKKAKISRHDSILLHMNELSTSSLHCTFQLPDR